VRFAQSASSKASSKLVVKLQLALKKHVFAEGAPGRCVLLSQQLVSELLVSEHLLIRHRKMHARCSCCTAVLVCGACTILPDMPAVQPVASVVVSAVVCVRVCARAERKRESVCALVCVCESLVCARVCERTHSPRPPTSTPYLPHPDHTHA